MQVNGLSGYQQVMEAEPKSMKTTILVGAGFGMVVSTIVGGLWAAGMANASKLDNSVCDLAPEGDSCKNNQSLYDYGFFVGFTKLSKDMWTDKDQANEYLKDLYEGCDITETSTSPGKDLEECFDGGSKWSVVWSLNAITVLMIAAANLLMMLGAY